MSDALIDVTAATFLEVSEAVDEAVVGPLYYLMMETLDISEPWFVDTALHDFFLTEAPYA